MTKWTWDYNWKIQKFNNTIYIGTLAINDKTISMRTIKTLFRKQNTSLLINKDIFLRSGMLQSESSFHLMDGRIWGVNCNILG